MKLPAPRDGVNLESKLRGSRGLSNLDNLALLGKGSQFVVKFQTSSQTLN